LGQNEKLARTIYISRYEKLARTIHIEEHGLDEEQSIKQITLKDKVGGGS
jgi:hypothetical protein